MKWTSWAFLAFLGSVASLVLFIADRQIESLKSTVASLQKIVDELQAAKKAAEDQKKAAAPLAKDAPAAKDAPK